jgi:hypothetical protein
MDAVQASVVSDRSARMCDGVTIVVASSNLRLITYLPWQTLSPEHSTLALFLLQRVSCEFDHSLFCHPNDKLQSPTASVKQILSNNNSSYFRRKYERRSLVAKAWEGSLAARS